MTCKVSYEVTRPVAGQGCKAGKPLSKRTSNKWPELQPHIALFILSPRPARLSSAIHMHPDAFALNMSVGLWEADDMTVRTRVLLRCWGLFLSGYLPLPGWPCTAALGSLYQATWPCGWHGGNNYMFPGFQLVVASRGPIIPYATGDCWQGMPPLPLEAYSS